MSTNQCCYLKYIDFRKDKFNNSIFSHYIVKKPSFLYAHLFLKGEGNKTRDHSWYDPIAIRSEKELTYTLSVNHGLSCSKELCLFGLK
jgi:hypothetical protein